MMIRRFALLAVLVVVCLGANGGGCNTPSLLIVSLDGGDWRYMDPLIAGGYLPTLGALRDGGTTGSTDCIGANSEFGCFCPIVHVSAVTGWPSSAHGIVEIGSLPSARRKPAIWNVLRNYRPNSRIALASMRNTWPPEQAANYVITEPGAAMLGEEFYDFCTPGAQVAENFWPGSSTMPGTWTKPASLYRDLGLLPNSEPIVPFFSQHGADFTATRALTALTAAHAPGEFKLTAVTLHFIDKSLHLSCIEVHQQPYGPVDGCGMRESAAAWPGMDFHPCPFGWGNAASSYLEADILLGELLAAGEWDHVLIYSDHGMTLYPPGTTPVCHHGLGTPAQASASFGVYGPGVKAGQRLANPLDVLCVAPVAAYLLGIPVSNEVPCVASGAFSGLLADLFTPQYLASHPPRYTARW
jgi:hypothetical protein